MARAPEALITPAVLTWARETVGFSVKDLAGKLKIEPNQVYAWEAGNERPSVARLKTIADKLKRPLAVFYLPVPPEDMRPPKDFRGLIAGHADPFSPRLHIELRLTEARREDALNLLEELDEEPIEFSFKTTLDNDPEQVATQLTRFLDINNDTISQCKDPYDARKTWKTAVEEKGVLVFQTTGVQIKEIRGFSLGLFPLPVVVVNGKDSPRGQIFSLLHELTHIALHQNGICDFDEDLPRAQDEQRVEVFCNHVAGAALVPKTQLLQHSLVRSNQISDAWSNDDLTALAKHFQCSREVVLRRLLINNLTTQAFYAQKREDFIQEYKKLEESRRDSGFPVRYFKKVINRNGYFFSRLVVDSYKREVITGPELSRLLNMKLKHLGDISHALHI